MSRFALLALVLGGSLFAGVTTPYTINSTNNYGGTPDWPFTVDYNGFNPNASSVIPGLTAQVKFENFSFGTWNAGTGTEVTFKFTVNNTSTITSRVSGLAFDTTPALNVSQSSVGGGPDATPLFNKIDGNGTHNNPGAGTYPNAIGKVDFCFTDGGSCSGGASGGVLNGSSDWGTATLRFNSLFTSLTFDNFYVRYQSMSYCPTSSCSETQLITSAAGTAVSTVPEPRLILFLSAGVVGVLAARFRRRTAA